MAKPLVMVNRIQPLQLDTIELAPKSYIRGDIGKPVNVVGTVLAGKLTLARKNGVSLPSGTYRLEVTAVGATGVGKFKIVDVDHGTESQAIETSATPISGYIAGIDVTLADTENTVIGDYVEFLVDGDQTFIIPGTVVGRYKSDHPTLANKWAPVYDDTISSFDQIRVVHGYQETDKTKTIPASYSEVNISNNFTTSCYVFAQLIEGNVHNLTATLKSKLTGIVWE